MWSWMNVHCVARNNPHSSLSTKQPSQEWGLAMTFRHVKRPCPRRQTLLHSDQHAGGPRFEPNVAAPFVHTHPSERHTLPPRYNGPSRHVGRIYGHSIPHSRPSDPRTYLASQARHVVGPVARDWGTGCQAWGIVDGWMSGSGVIGRLQKDAGCRTREAKGTTGDYWMGNLGQDKHGRNVVDLAPDPGRSAYYPSPCV